jgi:YhcH/YjgK/YiaL family protein
MIYDNLTNWNQYFDTPIFDEIYQKLITLSVNTKNGEYFRTEHYYFKVMSYDTMPKPTVIESHRKEVDVQVVLMGGERIKIYNPSSLKIVAEYSEESDCQFYKTEESADMEFKLFPGKMAVFFPQDIHGCQYTQSNEIETIKKIVIKIDEKLFTH